MSRIILNRSFNPPRKFNPNLHPCFKIRGIVWIHSLVAADDTRCICVFEAPYAELIRDACRQAATAYEQIWRAERCLEQNLDSVAANTPVIIVEVANGSLISPHLASEAPASGYPDFQDHQIQPVLSLTSTAQQYSIFAFNADSIDQVQQAYNDANIPMTRIWRSHLVTPSPIA